MVVWHEKSKWTYLLDFQIPISDEQLPAGQPTTLRNLDPEKIVGQLKEAGVTGLYVPARDYSGCCYYNTVVGRKHPAIGDRDMLAEFSRACRQADMSVLFYLYIALACEPRGSSHAEASYARVKRDGTREPHTRACFNGPAREYVKALISEVAGNYDFDGFWFDCFTWGASGYGLCYCEHCRRKYYEDTRSSLPEPDDRGSSAFRSYVRWARRQNTQVRREFRDRVRAANPKLTVTYNNGRWNTLFEDFEEFDPGDYTCTEFRYDFGHGKLAVECLQNAAVGPSLPFEVEIWRYFVRKAEGVMRSHQVRTPAHLFTEMATVAAHGGIVQFYDQINMDGTVDRRSLEMLKPALAELNRREGFWPRDEKRVTYASLLWSKQTEGFSIRPEEARHHSGRTGFHYALMEMGIPHDVLTDRSLREGKLGDAPVIVLPDVSCLSEAAAEHLRAYVEEGGGLVATYRTSLQDEYGRPRENFLLADLLGADYVEPLTYEYSYTKFAEENELTEGLPLDWPMSVFKEYQLKVTVRDGARGLGCIVHPVRGWSMGYQPGEDTSYPALVTNELGKGRVVYFPQPIGLSYDVYGHPDTRRAIVNAIRWAARVPPLLEVKAPLTVEVVPWESRSGDTLAIHVINRTASGPPRAKGAVIIEPIPVHDITLRFPFSAKKAILEPEGVDLPLRATDGGSELVVPEVEIHSAVVVKT